MEWIRIAAVTVAVLLLGIKDTYAQQHYKGVSALELNYGTNILVTLTILSIFPIPDTSTGKVIGK